MDAATMNRVLEYGVKNGASDIHFRPGEAPTFRVTGELRAMKADKLTAQATRQIALNLITDTTTQAGLDEIQEYDTSYSINGVSRFRVNIYKQRSALAVVLRIIPNEVPTLDSLKLPPVVKQIASHERGLILVTGATGSGKTTTLAAMLNHINQTQPVHILTIEDPIEYVHRSARASISQREVGLDTQDFSAALRSALRQDPDVIFVGELRDYETVDIALKAAETGHLVLATVHTTDAVKTIGRILSFFPGDEQHAVRGRLAETLKATISQRLLPKIDGRGMALAMEIMVATQTVREYIQDSDRTGALKDVIEKGRTTYGMQSFDQHLSDLYRAQEVKLEVARAAASNPADFERALNFE
ncbi:MAG: type IV pilus twitching motility protein PilT [Archangium sp.]